ncbi:hypothetical protein [uncultured Microbulbifer sp.]|uniref:hypothetical protein n=1 Tax=uncultured Microbulbifer sp. TaxID=348147 RepID=UPI002613855B|nr:hypothetical protein [uncultured Microbulbifer sp.]
MNKINSSKNLLWIMSCVQSHLLDVFHGKLPSKEIASSLTDFSPKKNRDRDIFICVAPETAVALAVDSGEDYMGILQSWRQEAEFIIRSLINVSKDSAVLFYEDFASSPTNNIKMLTDTFDLDSKLFFSELPNIKRPSQLAISLSAKLVQRQRDVQVLIDKLQQRSMLPRLKKPYLDGQELLYLLDEIRDKNTQIKLTKKNAAQHKEENNILLKQLLQAEMELKYFFVNSKIIPEKGKVMGSMNLFRFNLIYNSLRQLKKLINPKNPTIWRLTSSLRERTRPLRLKLVKQYNL